MIRIRFVIRILDPDRAIFVIDLEDARQKLIFNTTFSAYYFLNLHLHHLRGFSYYFLHNDRRIRIETMIRIRIHKSE